MENPAVTETATQRLNSAEDAAPHSHDKTSDAEDTTSQAHLHDSKNDHGSRRVIRNFSPSWFSVTMGTGIVSDLFVVIPWQADWLHYLSIIFFVLNVALFFSFLAASIARYVIWPEIFEVMIEDPVNSLFLGTIPMGFATIIEMIVFVCVPAWGKWAVWFAFGLWVLHSIVAVAVTVTLGILL